MSDYKTYAETAAKNAGIDSGIFLGLLESESSWNPKAISSKGAIGIAQFMPSTAANAGYGIAPFDPLDPYASIDAAAQYFKGLLGRYGSESYAIKRYKGFSDLSSPSASDAVEKVKAIAGKYGYKEPGKEVELSDKSLWQYNWQDWKNLFNYSIAGMSIGIIGFLIIVFAIVAIYFKNNPVAVKV